MPFTIVRQDITRMNVDAIVNAANTALQMGGGVCGAIFRAAGEKQMTAACQKLGSIRTGEAVMTPGFGLPAKYVIHTAGPVYSDGNQGEEVLLAASYENSMKLAIENDLESIAFPLISSGIYGYPKREALAVAQRAISDFLSEHDLDVYLALFDKTSFAISEALLGDVQSFIDEHYVYQREETRQMLDVEQRALREARQPRAETTSAVLPLRDKDSFKQGAPVSLDETCEPLELFVAETAPNHALKQWIENRDISFAQKLFVLIDERGKTDAEVYRRANVDRKVFSKIRGDSNYTPRKQTILALAIALELSLDETEDLLRRAGHALSPSRVFDLIVQFFIINKRYDIYEINNVLFQYDQVLLGSQTV